MAPIAKAAILSFAITLSVIGIATAVGMRPAARSASIKSGPAPKAIVDSTEDAALLASYQLLIPVLGVKYPALRDNFDESRNGHRHEALDIMAPRGTPVLAVGDGRVVKLFNSKAGGITVYQFDPNDKFAYYYAHLDRYAEGLKVGATLKRGEVLGYVGSTGNALPHAPHLHFTIFKLDPEKQWWKGTAVNPYPYLGR